MGRSFSARRDICSTVGGGRAEGKHQAAIQAYCYMASATHPKRRRLPAIAASREVSYSCAASVRLQAVLTDTVLNHRSQSTSFTSEPSQASAPYQAARNPPALAPAHAPYTPMGWPEGYSDYDARHGQGSISAAYGYGGYGGYGYPLPPTAPSHGAASDNITQESAPHSQRWSAQPSPSAAAAAAFTAQSRGGYGQDGVMAAAAAAAAVAHGHAGYGQASAAGLLTQSGRAFAPRTQQGAMAMQAAAAAAASGQGYTGYNPGQTTHGTGAQSTAPDASSDQEISNETAMAVAMARAAAHAYAGTGRGRGRGRGGGGGGSFRGFGSGGAW